MIINDKDNYCKIRDSISMNNLSKIMENKGYSSVKVAMETKVSTSTINAYMNGQKLPSVTTLVSLANFLDCNIDYLLDRTTNPMKYEELNTLNNNEELLLLLKNVSSLPKDKQNLVISIVKNIINS